MIVRIAVSGLVLLAALWIIFSNAYPDKYNEWAFGMVGLVVGYWLR